MHPLFMSQNASAGVPPIIKGDSAQSPHAKNDMIDVSKDGPRLNFQQIFDSAQEEKTTSPDGGANKKGEDAKSDNDIDASLIKEARNSSENSSTESLDHISQKQVRLDEETGISAKEDVTLNEPVDQLVPALHAPRQARTSSYSDQILGVQTAQEPIELSGDDSDNPHTADHATAGFESNPKITLQDGGQTFLGRPQPIGGKPASDTLLRNAALGTMSSKVTFDQFHRIEGPLAVTNTQSDQWIIPNSIGNSLDHGTSQHLQATVLSRTLMDAHQASEILPQPVSGIEGKQQQSNPVGAHRPSFSSESGGVGTIHNHMTGQSIAQSELTLRHISPSGQTANTTPPQLTVSSGHMADVQTNHLPAYKKDGAAVDLTAGQAAMLPTKPAPDRPAQSIQMTAFSAQQLSDGQFEAKVLAKESPTTSPLDIPLTHISSHNSIASRADLPLHIARQLADVMRHAPSRPVEITLNPDELGRVRLSMTQSEQGIVFNVLAERPETLDLMRRHIEQLAQEFRSMGYEDIAFSFSSAEQGSSDGEGEQQQPAISQHKEQDHKSDGLQSTQIHLSDGAKNGLDLRL
ncbi:MAG: flagellar hook-length control protein FliK [Sulfitobacter sp.]